MQEFLKGSPKSLVWGPNQQKAFLLTKDALAKATSLAHQNPNTPLQLMTDACTIKYLPGRKNPVADALSRIKIDSVQLRVDYEEAADPETPTYRTAVTLLRWKDVPFGLGGLTFLSNVSTGRPRPLVPASRRRRVFDVIHVLSHPSGRTTARLLMEKFVWHGIRKDAMAWVRQCMQCQASKVGRHTESGVGEFPQPKRCFGHIHVDVVVLFPHQEEPDTFLQLSTAPPGGPKLCPWKKPPPVHARKPSSPAGSASSVSQTT